MKAGVVDLAARLVAALVWGLIALVGIVFLVVVFALPVAALWAALA